MQYPARCKSSTRSGIFRIALHPPRGNVKFPRPMRTCRLGLSALLIDITSRVSSAALRPWFLSEGLPHRLGFVIVIS